MRPEWTKVTLFLYRRKHGALVLEVHFTEEAEWAWNAMRNGRTVTGSSGFANPGQAKAQADNWTHTHLATDG